MDEPQTHRYAWIISNVISIILFIAILWIWFAIHTTYIPYTEQLTSPIQVQQFINQEWLSKHPTAKPIYIPTGIVINTLSFKTPNDLLIAGYLWQHYSHNLPDWIKRQVFLMDQIEFNKQDIVYEHQYSNEDIIQTSFEVVIRQGFSYNKYPFDDKIVALSIWPANFEQNIIITPDLAAYKDVRPGSLTGIDPDITMHGFTIQESYFRYELTNFNTNFGIPNLLTQRGYPELNFVIVLKRALFSAFVVHVLPLIIVIILLFASLMMNTERKIKFVRFNFTGTMSVASCSALFFVLVLVHAGLRTEIYADQIIYLEYFYFLAYVLIALIVINNYLLLNDVKKKFRLIHYGDNLLPKVFFWPSILLFTLVVSIKELL